MAARAQVRSKAGWSGRIWSGLVISGRGMADLVGLVGIVTMPCCGVTDEFRDSTPFLKLRAPASIVQGSREWDEGAVWIAGVIGI